MPNRIKDTLLLVGDADSSRSNLRDIFKDSYNLLEAENLAQALLLLEQNAECILLILVDVLAPDKKETKQLMEATLLGGNQKIPVVVFIDTDAAEEHQERAFLMGVSDVILKPYAPVIVQKRIETLVELYWSKWNLERIVQTQNETIRNANQIMLDTMSAIIEHRNTESGNHVLRIRQFTKILLSEVARTCPEYELTEDVIDMISSASSLHDIGKISIPDAVLNKPGKLTEEEYEIMKNHSVIGSQLVSQMEGASDELFLRYAYNISLYHHERWDGRGYPEGLKGDDIPICAQVVGLADAFDALTTNRVYKPAYGYQKAINMILNGECGAFSQKLLECFKRVRGDFVELASRYADGYSPKSDTITKPLPGPVWTNQPKNTLQMAQSKYYTMLHYLNDTIMELDLDNEIYHIVYNPDPDFDAATSHASFSDMVAYLRDARIHPEEVSLVDEINEFIKTAFFDTNLRRKSFSLRLSSAVTGTYQRYELTFLKINSGTDDNRFLTAIWHKLDQEERIAVSPSEEEDLTSEFFASAALKGLTSSIFRCVNNNRLTFDHGAKNLTGLVDYTEEEIKNQCGKCLMDLVHPEDRAILEEMILGALKIESKMEVEFRLIRKYREPLWVLAKSRLYTEEDGMEYFYFAVRDNSQSHALQQQLMENIERNQILIDQSGSIVFEWDLKEDSMYCSPKWEELFGYIPVSKNYGSQLGIATHFHPDDLVKLRSSLKSLMKGEISSVLEVRIANASGEYLWTKITAASVRNREGGLTKIIGFIQDIDELKKATLVLKTKSETDALTKLLNKESTQHQISAYLEERQPDELVGVLVLDLDNFKSINDTRGHMYGDMVLTQVGKALRKFFRTNDIVGRIGGDEFMILMKKIPSQKLLEERCELLLEHLRKVLMELVPDLNVSCSIGASMVPEHGTTYQELYQHADEALYHIKNRGKDQYKIFSFDDNYMLSEGGKSHNTRIDSDDPDAVTSESFERFVFRRLYE
ncbi:MAG: diguanylate cyclase, partial [Firmicutes bacterium]|nr:diguanylate cyclase [Bacillota bacterium]